MKRIIIYVLITVFSLSMVITGIGCTNNVPVSEAAEETTAEVVEETTATTDSTTETGETGKTAELEIAWIHYTTESQSEQRAYGHFMEYIESKGWEWTVTAVNSEATGEKFASNLEDAVARGVDAIIVSMAELKTATAALQIANDAGIPVFSIDSQYEPGVVCDITSNNYVMSSKVSSYFVDRLNGKGNICALRLAEHHGTRKRGEVFVDVILPENTGINLLEDYNLDITNFNEDAKNTVEDWLTKYGSDIDAIWAPWDEPAMVASDAILAAGFTRDDMFVTGIDGHDQAIDRIRSGDPLVATVAQAFEIMGQKCADLIQTIIVEGVPVDTAVTAKTIYIDAPLITSANVPAEGEPSYLTEDFYK